MKSFIGAVLFICVAFSANAQLLWKVSGNGLNQPSYIIGTHHLAPFSIMDSIAGLKKAMNETQQVYGEMKMSEMQSPATMEKMQKAMMIESDTTLNSLLSPKDFETANKFCKENLMVDLNMAPKLKPAFLLNKSNSTHSFKAKPSKTEKRWTDWKLQNSNSICFSMAVHYNGKHNY